MLLKPDGVPMGLVRVFKEKAHLQCFLDGNVLIRRLDFFRSIEDSTRQDKTEGEANLILPGQGGVDVHYGGSFHNPTYLLCCSELPTSVATTTDLGNWRATINDPSAFLSALSIAATAVIPGRKVFEAMLLKVRYTKATKSKETPPSEERYRLMLAQKSPCFAKEYEWRYALIFSGGVQDSPHELWLRINNMGAYGIEAQHDA
jgi:hypothetical protein